ncbi:MAG: hypothetical protein KAG28_08020 [Cocleimonas sp.]|nr:hypothetical protein [Cocleimonas sp.]
MKLQTITFVALIALTGTASANWFDGFNNGKGVTNGAGNTAGNTQGNVASKGNGAANGNGWATGKGDAAGEVDFSISFKGKGNTNMDTKGQLVGDTKVAGDATGNGAGTGNVAGNGATRASGANSTNGSAQTFNNNGFGSATAAPSAAQMKAALHAQIQQATAMLKRLEAQEKAAKTATSVEKTS